MKGTRISKEIRRIRSPASHTSQLVNDSGFLTEVEHKVTSVNGQDGEVILDIPEQVPSDWDSVSGPSRILNKPTIPTVRRMETYTGSTNSSGDFSVTYSTAYPSIPEVHPQIIAGTPSQVVTLRETTVNGFTVQVTDRSSISVLGVSVVSSTSTPVNGASVSILVIAR